jgi:hypothetical protein
LLVIDPNIDPSDSTSDGPDNEDDIDNDLDNQTNSKYRSVWSLKQMAGVFDLDVMDVFQYRQRGINLTAERHTGIPIASSSLTADSKFRSRQNIIYRKDHGVRVLCGQLNSHVPMYQNIPDIRVSGIHYCVDRTV